MLSAEQYRQLVEQKAALRRAVQNARRALPDKARRSADICRQILALPEYAAAQTVMLYLHMPHEVHTDQLCAAVWAAGKRVATPYVNGDEIGLFHLASADQLAPGVWDIPEPRPELRGLPEHAVAPETVDLVITPGVVFDRAGGRVGHGKGYYDKFLKHLGPTAHRVGLAFACQLVDEVPMLPHDVFMHRVITEEGVYAGYDRHRH